MSTDSTFRATPMTPLRKLVAITPDDNVDHAGGPYRGLYVGTTGNVSLILADDSSPVIMHNVAAGVFHPVIFKRVTAANTTAQNIRGGL